MVSTINIRRLNASSLLACIHHRLKFEARDIFNLLNGILVSITRLITIDQGRQLRELGLVNLRSSSDQWETHHNVRGCQIFACQPLSTIRRSLELLLQEAEVCIVVPVQELVLYTASDCASDWLDEERNWSTLDFCGHVNKWVSECDMKSTHDL